MFPLYPFPYLKWLHTWHCTWKGWMPKRCLLLNLVAKTHCFLYPPYPVTTSCSWTVSVSPDKVERLLSNLDSDSATGPDRISPHVQKPALLLFLTLSLFSSPSHSLKVICHLLGNQQTLPLCIKQMQNRSLQLQTNQPAPNHKHGHAIHHRFWHQIFLFSNGLISDHQFRFRPGHSTLDLVLLLFQQRMEVLSANHEIKAISWDISWAFDMVWYPAVLTKLSSYGIQGSLHS